MEKSDLKIGIFNYDGTLDMKVKKELFNLILEHILKKDKLCKEKYKVYVKLFNKFAQDKPKKYNKE